MTLVIDASVAIKWFVPEDHFEIAEKVLGLDDDLCAPDILLAEVANTFWKKVRRREMGASQAKEGIERLPGMFDVLAPTTDLVAPALSLSLAIDHPIYDCLYVVYAQITRVPCITADQRLANKMANTEYRNVVRHLTDF